MVETNKYSRAFKSKRKRKRWLILLLILIVLLQFIRPIKNKTLQENINPKHDITALSSIPTDVQAILKVSCYDCHSNNTDYPWYTNVQPVGWWMQFHVDEGKLDLNFNEFATYPARKQYRKMKELIDDIKSNDLHLPHYWPSWDGAEIFLN